MILGALFLYQKSFLLCFFRLFFLVFLITIFGFPFLAQNVKPTEPPTQNAKSEAGVRIEVYYDLQCPACRKYQSVLKNAEAKFGNQILVTFRHFPLRIPAHDKAIMAARMVEAAKLQGKGRLMLDTILANQENWTTSVKARTVLFGYAAKLNLDMRRFRDDYEDDKTMRPIIEDILRANKLKLTSTPTVFLNEKELSYQDALDLEARIKELIKDR